MKSYMTKIDGWVAGQRVAKGDLVVLTDAQAQYEPVTPVQMPAMTPRVMVAVTPPSTGLKPPSKVPRKA
jgi:hypothetical protein